MTARKSTNTAAAKKATTKTTARKATTAAKKDTAPHPPRTHRRVRRPPCRRTAPGPVPVRAAKRCP